MAHSTNIASLSAETFAELLSGPTIEITVGKDSDSKRWLLHHNLLRHHSPFFDDPSLIDNENSHIRDGKLELPDEDPAAFRILVKWLYQGTISDVSTLAKDKIWDYAYACQNLFLLASRLRMPALQNQAIDQFRRGCHESRLVPGAEEIKPIYERTDPGSPFRNLVSRIAARQIMDPDSKRDANMYKDCFATSSDFAVDVLNAIREGTDGLLLDDPTEGNGCRYHIHENGESCHKNVHFKDEG